MRSMASPPKSLQRPERPAHGRGLPAQPARHAVPDGSDFETDANFTLDASAMTHVRIDRATRASSWESGANAHATEGSTGSERAAGELPLGLVELGGGLPGAG